MPDVMELEARLKNLISGEMQNIVKSIDDVTKKNTESSKQQKKDNSLTEQSISKLSDSWNIAKIAAAGFIGAMGAMSILNKVTELIKGARQENKEWLQVQYQLKSSLGYSSSALVEQTQALQKNLAIEDDVIATIQEKISFFTKDEEQIKRLTQATLDFSAATGMDANSAAMLLGRSIENGGVLLSRYGLKIKETNDEFERAELIINAVNEKFKNQAEMVAMSKDGWDRLGISIKSVLQNIGNVTFNPWAFTPGNTEMEKMKNYYEFVVSENSMANEKIKARARLFLANYVSEEEGKRKGLENFKKEQNEREIEETKKIVNEVLQLTNEGKIKLLEIERDKRIKSVSNTEEGTRQKIEIEKLYTLKISELQNQLAEESMMLQKKVSDNSNRVLDQVNSAYEKEVKASIEAMKLLYEASEADIKANNDHAESQQKNISIIMNRKLKAKEQEKKDVDELKKKDDDARKSKIENTQLIADSSIGTLKNFAKASKASSALQKTLDIAQASANTAIAVSKALTPGLQWQIPFIIALGASQIALIASQKYEYGGIVPGNKTSGDRVPVMVNSREMILTLGQQENLFNMLSRPNQIYNSSSNQNSTNSNTAIHLNINVGNNGNYDMSAARYTVDQLTPIIGEALVKAKNEGRLRQYENSR
jgi:hypothetical protein